MIKKYTFIILGAEEERAETARLSSFVGAIAIGDLVKTTLGPKGMDKILYSMGQEGKGGDSIQVTNDGATILRSVGVDNPAAKVLVDISKVQDQEVIKILYNRFYNLVLKEGSSYLYDL